MVRLIEMKSVLIGGFLTTLILCLVGAVHYEPPERYGRFQIETNNSHAFILDSATGQVWSSSFYVSSSAIRVEHDPNFYAPKTYDEVDP